MNLREMAVRKILLGLLVDKVHIPEGVDDEDFDNLLTLCTLNGLCIDDVKKILTNARVRYVKKREEVIALIKTLQNQMT